MSPLSWVIFGSSLAAIALVAIIFIKEYRLKYQKASKALSWIEKKIEQAEHSIDVVWSPYALPLCGVLSDKIDESKASVVVRAVMGGGVPIEVKSRLTRANEGNKSWISIIKEQPLQEFIIIDEKHALVYDRYFGADPSMRHYSAISGKAGAVRPFADSFQANWASTRDKG